MDGQLDKNGTIQLLTFLFRNVFSDKCSTDQTNFLIGLFRSADPVLAAGAEGHPGDCHAGLLKSPRSQKLPSRREDRCAGGVQTWPSVES